MSDHSLHLLYYQEILSNGNGKNAKGALDILQRNKKGLGKQKTIFLRNYWTTQP